MKPKMPEGPICQSCGMPMDSAEKFGTESDGSKSKHYCFFCYQKGKFTDAKITMKEMIDKVSKFMAKETKMAEDEAKEMTEKFIPKLKRWQSK